MQNNTVITISREYGSGGRELSQILAKKLGVKLYDRQIISKAAAEVGVEDMDFDKLKKFEEEVPPLPVKFMPFYLFGVSAGPRRSMTSCLTRNVRLSNGWQTAVPVLFWDAVLTMSCVTERIHIRSLSVPMINSGRNAGGQYMRINP